MAGTQITPTRMELTRLKNKLYTAKKGHKLLKDKRDELMRQFLILVRENKELRERVEEGIKGCNTGFVMAKAGMSSETLGVALMAPRQQLTLEISEKNIMSVRIPEFKIKTKLGKDEDIYSYGYIDTSADLDTAVSAVAKLLPVMLKLAECEKACQLMAAEIEKTRRRVNALEYVMIPETEALIRSISMKLDENERSSQIRLMKVKDMMLEKAHHYKDKQAERN